MSVRNAGAAKLTVNAATPLLMNVRRETFMDALVFGFRTTVSGRGPKTAD
jgi:hypothetical protein